MANNQLSLDFDAAETPTVEAVTQSVTTPAAVNAPNVPKNKTTSKTTQIKSEDAPQNLSETQAPVVDQDPQILSITDLNKVIRQSLEGQFSLIWVKGEISNFKPHTSGHFYFSLKDAQSQISAVMFRGFNSRLKFKPENGMEVVVRGRVTVYEPRGTYQIFCEIMEPVGLGALQMAFEQLKNKLRAEGLFEPSRKKKLPAMPQKIGLVTSPTGAAIKDMLNVLQRRGRGLQITLIPALVQGAQAPQDIVRAIRLAESVNEFDVLIIGRGGGSIEDLWAFNDEAVARAIANCKIPTISAVGHEIDVTIADYVADLRAPTPSAAAELVVKNAADLFEKISLMRQQLLTMMDRTIKAEKRTLEALQRGLVDPKRKLQDLAIRCDEWSQRLELAIKRRLENERRDIDLLMARLGSPVDLIESLNVKTQNLLAKMNTVMFHFLETSRQEFSKLTGLLDTLSPLKVLERGYSIVKSEQQVITQSNQVKINDEIQIIMSEGQLSARVTKIDSKEK